ncbi:hypothetical protein DFH08DRAFT_979540 [Mycena albidolilacea]|uniref:Uncharacterized protein n=1 Tax=Mycena albidolilacea TaxID=1033008 RepID=A0AAD6YWJ6_9AGAR|nr:hypothetical protein DFH08DRAFT_979540 [Mycena albidolilacea]
MQGIPFTKIELYFPTDESCRPSRHLDRVAACLHWQLEAPWACPLFETDNLNDTFHRLEIPLVSSDAVSKGQWSVFAQVEPDEDEPEVGPLMSLRGSRSRGKGDTEGDEEVWYDQKMKHKLIFSDLPALPRFLREVDKEFSQPVPGWAFGSRRHRDWIGNTPLVWMYKREKASRLPVGERYSPPTPLARSPVMELPPVMMIPATSTAHEASPSEGSVVSLRPEEDAEMVDVGTQGIPEEMEPQEMTAENESTYVLIHRHSFSFGLGDLRLWLRHPASAMVPTSIVGIYRLVQSDYRVDYFFKKERSETLIDITPVCHPRAPDNVPEGEVLLKEQSGALGIDIPVCHPLVPGSVPECEVLPLHNIAITADNIRRPPRTGVLTILTEGEALPPVTVDETPGPLSRKTDFDRKTGAGEAINGSGDDGENVGSNDLGCLSSRTTYSASSREAVGGLDGGSGDFVGFVIASARAIDRSQETLAGSVAAQARDGKAGIDGSNGSRFEGGVSIQTTLGHKHAHNRPKKRLERLLRLEEEIQREWEDLQWSDADIDWFIDQEELLPTHDNDEDQDRMDMD